MRRNKNDVGVKRSFDLGIIRINGTGNFWNIESYSAVRYNREKVDGELFK